MIKDLIKEGFILKSKGHYTHAIEAFYKALELDNNSYELLYEIACIYYLMGEEERALNYTELVLAKNPAHINTLTFLKKLFISKNAWQEAEQTARNIYAITKRPEDFADVLSLLNKQGLYQKVLNSTLDTKEPRILFELAFANLFNNSANNALTFIDEAIDLEPNNLNFLLLKGKILYKLDRKDDCVKLLEKFEFNNENPDFLNFAGLVRQYQKDYKAAIIYFKAAIKHSTHTAEYYYNCASTYFKMNDISQARKYYNLAISLDGKNPVYHFALANLYYSQKQYKRALEELKSDLFEAKLLRAIILHETGFFAISRKELEILAKEAPDNEIIKLYQEKNSVFFKSS